MKIQILCRDFSGLTGSEVYNYELAVALLKMGHTVQLESLNDSGLHKHFENELTKYENFAYSYPTSDVDLLIFSQHETIDHYISHYHVTLKNIPKLQICHHETYPNERPHPAMDMHVSCREFDNLFCIGNPIDLERFNAKDSWSLNNIGNHSYGLFIGSIDVIRYPVLLKLSKQASNILVVGRNDYPKIPGITYMDPNFDSIPFFIKNAAYCIGVSNGRTMIESLACGTPYYNYNFEEESFSEVCLPSHLDSQESLTKFEELHGSMHVAKRLLNYFEEWKQANLTNDTSQ